MPISELIQYYRNLPHSEKSLTDLARKAANGVLWDTEMQSILWALFKYLRKRKTKCLEISCDAKDCRT